MKTQLLFILLLVSFFFTNAQNNNENAETLSSIKITGTVVDKDNGTPLPYAYLKIDNVGLGTVTEGNGKFQITIPSTYDTYFITISYLGFEDLKLTVKEFKSKNGASFSLKPEAFSLEEVIVEKQEKLPSAKSLLRKVIKKIPTNYVNSETVINGYYRETMKENGEYIKYSDAVCDYYAEPYKNKKYKWKDYQYPYDNSSVGGVINLISSSLHRIHFHHKTLKNEKVHIINSRSSSNLSKKGFESNIEGGPLSLFARDRVKYQESFLGKKATRDFTYQISEELDETGTWLYVLDFHTKTTKEELDAIASPSNRRQWKKANKHKLLKGKIYINQDDLAITRFECAIPNNLKQYFCGYNYNEIKHFDYKLDIRYKKEGDQYYIDKMRHEDEFIYKDSIKQNTTYYSAISEFKAKTITTKSTKKISRQENFANTIFNQLYEFPLEYDSIYWQNYTIKNSSSIIDSTIRKDMEVEKNLEKQFLDKHIRNDSMPIPIAPIIPSTFKIHGENYTDNYAWLKDTKAPKANKPVMDYLREENKYVENYNIPLRKVQRSIYQGLIKNVEKNTTSLPVKRNGYFYYNTFSDDDEYPVYYRKAIENDTIGEEILNVNNLAKEKEYYTASIGSPSPNSQLISVYENTTGKDVFTLKIKDLTSQTFLTDSINHAGAMLWLDNKSFIYIKVEKQTFRSYKVLKHILDTDSKLDVVIYEEKDPSFSVGIQKSKSKDYIFLSSSNSTSSEIRYLKTDNLNGQFRVIKPREKNHIYSVSHHKNKFYIATNKNALNYKIVTVDVDNPSEKNWIDIIAHQPSVLIEGFQIYDNYMVINEKENAQPRIKIINLSTQENHFIKFKEEFYNINLGYNPKFSTDSLLFTYSSFETPLTTYKYNMSTKKKRMVKQHSKPITHPFYKYVVERKWVVARDGKRIPLTLIRHKWRTNKGKNNRVYLTSYGSYGSGLGLAGDPMAHHLVNSGYVYAIAHVRGGNDMGTEWYEDGKLFNKKNTFTDFIACAEYLITEKYAKKGSITASGGSAGGLLMGAVVNERPELFNTVFLDVPFVDVINTMLDEKLPLTTDEYNEWGNPNNKKEYDYIKSYSPYDNVKAQEYPNLIFSTGLNDTRVGYWEPAKMVAKLRTKKTDSNLLLLKTSFTNGHGGGSGRYAGYRNNAYKLALIYDLYNIYEEKKQ